MTTIVLASSSKYRRQLLAKLGLDFICHAADVDETPVAGERPEALVARLSIAKAQAVGKLFPNHTIIGSDQVAAFDSEILGKPGSKAAAVEQLSRQSGRSVNFYTGICLLDAATGHYLTDLDICTVYFKALEQAQIQRYVERDQPFDCAGSFKSESLGIALFDKIVGDDPNALVGLPLIKLVALLEKFGIGVI